MKKVWKYLAFACAVSGTLGTVGAYSESGSYGGSDGKSIRSEWWTGWNITGDYTEAHAKEKYGKYYKRVYARSGSEGSYCDWAGYGIEAWQKDMGPYSTRDYEARFYWDY